MKRNAGAAAAAAIFFPLLLQSLFFVIVALLLQWELFSRSANQQFSQNGQTKGCS